MGPARALRSGAAALALTLAPAAGAHAAAGAPPPPTVTLTRLVFDMADGAPYDIVQAGLLCGPKGLRRWRGTPFPDALARYGEALRGALATVGLAPAAPSTELFTPDAAEPAFALGAVVSDLHQRTCEVNAFTGAESSVKGRAGLTVQWQLFSRASGQVAGRFETQGKAVIARSVPGGPGRLSTAAFADAAVKLVRLDAFRRTVGASPP